MYCVNSMTKAKERDGVQFLLKEDQNSPLPVLRFLLVNISLNISVNYDPNWVGIFLCFGGVELKVNVLHFCSGNEVVGLFK